MTKTCAQPDGLPGALEELARSLPAAQLARLPRSAVVEALLRRGTAAPEPAPRWHSAV